MKSSEMPEDRGPTDFRGPGTRRARLPTDTLARLSPRLREFGITRVANVTGLDTVGIPVVMVVRPNGCSLSVTQGKGCDLPLAKASGIMEAVEQHFAEVFAPKDLRLAEIDKILAEGGISPELWPGGTDRVPRRRRLIWIRSETLLRTAGPWVPFDLVHLDFRVDHPLRHGTFPVSSNGLASGNCWSEAMVHGACELIERDASCLFYQSTVEQQLARRIAPDTVTGKVCSALLQRFEAAGILVAIWDVTSDLGVASFLVATLERDPSPTRRTGVALGAGAHLEREVALARALCEAAQSRLTRIAGVRDDIVSEDFNRVRSLESDRRWRSLMQVPQTMRDFDSVTDWQHTTFEDDLCHLESILAGADLGPILTVDLAPGDEDFAVVRVLIPGLEGNFEFPGYRPGPRARSMGRRGP